MMRVLVTRPVEQAEETAEKLNRLGHECVVAPLMEIIYFENLRIGVEGLSGIVATSGRAIESLARQPEFHEIRGLPFFCVGQHSAEIATRLGFSNIAIVGKNVEDLCKLLDEGKSGRTGKLLYAAGSERMRFFEDYFADSETELELAVLYEARKIGKLPSNVVDRLKANQIDAVLVYSVRSAEALVCALKRSGLDGEIRQLKYLAISRFSAEPLKSIGNAGIREAREPNEDALFELINELQEEMNGI